jgi:hypothetical protein
VQLARRGGTDLVGEYSWRAVDTLSVHIDLLLDSQEIPIGWGAAEQRRLPQARRGEHGGSLRRNPRAGLTWQVTAIRRSDISSASSVRWAWITQS